MTAATEVKPQPYLIDCSVRNDRVTPRTLVVKPVESSGYAGLAWREAWRAQLLADQRGHSESVPAFFVGTELLTVYAAADPLLPLLRFRLAIGIMRRWPTGKACTRRQRLIWVATGSWRSGSSTGRELHSLQALAARHLLPKPR